MLDFVKDLIGFKLIDSIYLKILNWKKKDKFLLFNHYFNINNFIYKFEPSKGKGLSRG